MSTAIACPYSGPVDPNAAAAVAAALIEMGCYEVSMGDTIGVGTPASTEAMFAACLKHVPAQKLAAHMHDTYGQAIANIMTALQMGVWNSFPMDVYVILIFAAACEYVLIHYSYILP